MFLRVAAYAKKYECSRDAVYKWIREGKLPIKKVGGLTLVIDGEPTPTQLERIEKKIDDLLHEVRIRSK